MHASHRDIWLGHIPTEDLGTDNRQTGDDISPYLPGKGLGGTGYGVFFASWHLPYGMLASAPLPTAPYSPGSCTEGLSHTAGSRGDPAAL